MHVEIYKFSPLQARHKAPQLRRASQKNCQCQPAQMGVLKAMSHTVTSVPAAAPFNAMVDAHYLWPVAAPSDEVNVAILAVIHTGVLGRRDALALCANAQGNPA
jgi:hypothetical protein